VPGRFFNGLRPPLKRRRLLVWTTTVSALVIAAPSAFADTGREEFFFDPKDPSAQHTWTVPDDVTEVTIEVAGGGGGGGENVTRSGGNGALVEAILATQGGQSLTIGIGGGGSVFTGTGIGGGGGGGASIVTSSSEGLTDLLVIAGGGGGAGQGTNLSVSTSGGSAGVNAAGDGGSGGAYRFSSNGKGGGGGIRGDGFIRGRNYVAGSSTQTGAGGAGGREMAAEVGGAGGGAAEVGSGGGGGGAGYGGGGRGGSGNYGGLIAALGGGGGGSIADGAAVSPLDGRASYYSTAGGLGGVQRAGAPGWVVITWVIPPPRPNPVGKGTGLVAVQRQPVVFQLSMPVGVECSSLQVDSSGPWVRLPAADDCSIESNARVGSVDDESGLLGWATTPEFPVDLAQRQVDNGWGAYETFDSSGDLTAVFIPAGGWAEASSDTSLFPIWAAESTD